MTDRNQRPEKPAWGSQAQLSRLRKRHQSEKRFRLLGLAAIILALCMLATLVGSIASKGYTAFVQTYVTLDIDFSEALIDPSAERDPKKLAAASYGKLVQNALRKQFPDVAGRRDLRSLFGLVSKGATRQLRQLVITDPHVIGSQIAIALPMSDDIDMLFKGHIDRNLPEADRRVKDKEVTWFETLVSQGKVEGRFNRQFFTGGDSREPEMAGILGAVVGSFYTLLVTLLISFPIGVMTAIYLEEFAPKNWLTDIVEININNLAAVPSIVFGLLGLAVFLNFAQLPRSASLVGGMTLALMTLPTIIISSRAAIRAVPDSIRQGALGLGASPLQTGFHHVLPLALPGICTGTIIGLSQALGETAPLLMIGMVAFIVDIPCGFTDPATTLPVQIFLWADSPERAFVEKTSGAILVLLGFLVFMNAFAVLLRKKFERRW